MRLRFSLLLLPLLAAGLGPAAQAQTASLVGEIVDADSDRPLPTATVALLVADSLITGATADFDGAFRVQAPPGTYDVRVTFVGYDPLRQPGVTLGDGETDLGQIRLTPSAEALAEVSVAAERPQRQSRIDRTVYDTADDPVAEGGNATDVLSTIPSVDVDVDGNISLRGSGNVAVQRVRRQLPREPALRLHRPRGGHPEPLGGVRARRRGRHPQHRAEAGRGARPRRHPDRGSRRARRRGPLHRPHLRARTVVPRGHLRLPPRRPRWLRHQPPRELRRGHQHALPGRDRGPHADLPPPTPPAARRRSPHRSRSAREAATRPRSTPPRRPSIPTRT